MAAVPWRGKEKAGPAVGLVRAGLYRQQPSSLSLPLYIGSIVF